jgi:hypothetical protein
MLSLAVAVWPFRGGKFIAVFLPYYYPSFAAGRNPIFAAATLASTRLPRAP